MLAGTRHRSRCGAGDESEPLFLSALERSEICTTRAARKQTHSKCVAAVFNKNETEVSRLIRLNTVVTCKIFPSPHRRRHQHEVPSPHEHHRIITKQDELGWLAQQTMIALMALLSLIDSNEHATDKDVDGAEFVGEICSHLAEDKLHYRMLKKPMLVTCGGAAWANRRDLTNQCGFLCITTEENFMDGHAVPCNPVSWHSVQGPLKARVVQRPDEQVKDKMRWRMSGVFGMDTARHGGLATARPTNNGNACFLLIESKCSKLRQDRKVLVSPWQTNVQQKLCLCANHSPEAERDCTGYTQMLT